jgi:hypothetical protein
MSSTTGYMIKLSKILDLELQNVLRCLIMIHQSN